MIGQNETKENQKEFNKLFDNSKMLKNFYNQSNKSIKILIESRNLF